MTREHDWLASVQTTLNNAHLQIVDHVWQDNNQQWNASEVVLLEKVDRLIMDVEQMRLDRRARHAHR